jgi:hypothetical protein
LLADHCQERIAGQAHILTGCGLALTTQDEPERSLPLLQRKQGEYLRVVRDDCSLAVVREFESLESLGPKAVHRSKIPL